MSEKAIIFDAVNVAATRCSFKPVGKQNYFLEQEETVAVLNIQTSRFGPQHYLNAGLWIDRFGHDRRPKHYKCQIQWRLDALMPELEAQGLNSALDLTNSLAAGQRSDTISSAVEVYGFDILKRCSLEKNALALAEQFGGAIAVFQSVYLPSTTRDT